MKTKAFLLILMVSTFIFANAQMDDKFYFPSKTMKTIDWKNVENISFAVDTDSITGIILKPNQKAKATVFYYHGAGGNVSSYAPIVVPLLEDNYQVVLVDFRGYGKSTGTPLHKNIAGDAELIFNSLIKRNDIKDTKKIIYGASIGTQIATHLAKSHQAQLSGLVLEGAMISFGDIAAYYAPEFKDYLINNFITPYSAKQDISSITLPKLFIHSKEDKDVPYDQGLSLFNSATEPKQFIEFQGEHLMGLKYDSQKIIQSLNTMIAK